ncbi:MAG: hypothetical protein JWO36_1645 [Myxococcales bacterium]|nr:hypothetical protein [Myxococcales bacterium]
MRKAISSLSLLLAACAAKAPPDVQNNPDGGDGVDAPANVGMTVSGKVMDYFTAAPLDNTTVASDGLDPAVTTTSATDGAYSLNIATGSKLFFLTSRTSYRATRSAAITVADVALTQDIYAMSAADVRRQYTSLGKAPTAGTAFVAADLVKQNATPIVGIPLANVTLVDANNQPVPGVVGPYFFGAVGDIDPALTTATAYGTPPRSRVAFLDVPPGTFTISVTFPNMAGNTQILTLFTAAADGANIVVTGNGGAGSAQPPLDPKFSTDIYPRLQKAASGGSGCANCHTAGGPGAVLKYDDPADLVLTNMKAITGVLDLVTPANSLLLKKPLYELPPAVQDHPNATFLDINDPDYKLILLWIKNGAKP